mmetsp:Transcript_13607/g.35106  ORF Transcript_13607/g.35106 Transcript_13607/m.35106 type:complete len:88 (+) Transcript_13607:59-322(+)
MIILLRFTAVCFPLSYTNACTVTLFHLRYHYHNEVKGVEAAHSFGFQYEFLKVLMSGGFIQVCLPETESGSCLTGIAEKREEETEGE